MQHPYDSLLSIFIKNQINYDRETINYFPLLPTPYYLLPFK